MAAVEHDQLTFTRGQSNSKVAVYKGHLFLKSKTRNSITYFACRSSRKTKCPAYVILRDYDPDAETYSKFDPPRQKHNHKPEPRPHYILKLEDEQEVNTSVQPILTLPKGRFASGLKLVDDDGKEIQSAITTDDIVANNHRNLDRSDEDVENVNHSENFIDDDGCSGGGDFDGGDISPMTELPDAEASPPRPCPLMEKLVSTSSNFKTLTSASKASTKPTIKIRNARITEERCCICGDHLISSEASVCNEETFRKACTYLNVRSEREWFSKNDGFFSFCDLCSKEIMQIHDLYRKVEEIQTVILRKVEGVEKRVVDAEIVDNWKEDTSPSTVRRFEGFRKQVMINYRNKLKLRRKVREGRKIGHNLSEAVPVTSARMFVSVASRAPTTTYNDNQAEMSSSESIMPPRRSRRMLEKTCMQEGSDDEPENEFGYDDDNDSQSVVSSEQEVKFWRDDPSQLRDDLDVSHGNNGDSDMDCHEGDIPREVTDEDDPDYVRETEDEKSVKPKAPSSIVRKKSTSKFPETVLHRDGRMFMQGIEIIKNPPGLNPKRPYSASFSCGTCGQVLPTIWSIRVHICGHHLGLYKCTICSKKYSQPRHVERHMQQVHTKSPKGVDSSSGGDNMTEDDPDPGNDEGENVGVKSKPTSSPLRKRYNIQFPETVVRRDGRIFMQGIEITKNPPGHIPSRPNIPSFTCLKCGKIAPSFWKIRVHICGQHLGMFKCSICLKQFSQPREMERHMERLHIRPDELFPCPVCEKPFKGETSLKEHMWTHLSEEEKKAEENQKYKPLKLRKGETSSGETGQSFMCSFCSRTFSNQGLLFRHEKTHTTESRPGQLQCQSCGRLCSSKRSFKVHESLCRKKAMGIVDTTTYPCRYCPKRYKSIAARSRHRRRFHRDLNKGR